MIELEKTCLGLGITSMLAYEDEDFVPLEVITVVKTMEKGDLGYRIYCTPNLGTVDGLGMMNWADLMLKIGIQRIITGETDE